MWGQNANTQPIFFWFMAYANSTPGLLEQLRKEIAPYTGFPQVHLWKAKPWISEAYSAIARS